MNPFFIDEQDNTFDYILNKTGRNDRNRRTLSRLRDNLPRREWLAVSQWITTFFGYQQNWLLDINRYSVLVKSRQTGASHTYAGVAVLWGLLGEDTSIISKGQREADLVLRNVVKHCKLLVELGSEWAKLRNASAERVILQHDGLKNPEIRSLPPASGARGFSSNVILDEFAYYENPDKLWDAAAAVSTHNYKVRIMSTPNGVGNEFYSLVKHHEERGYHKWSTNIEEAIADGIRIEGGTEGLLQNACKGDPRIYAQLYMCSFLDSEFQYIPTELIQKCCTDFLPESGKEEPFYGGLDIGRSNDLTVLITLQRAIHNDRRVYVVRNIEKHRRTSSDGLKKLVADGFAKYRYKRLSLDATGIGAFPADEMVKTHGFSKVDPIHFTNQVKEELATGLYLAINKKLLVLPDTKLIGIQDPKDVKLLKEDIASIQRIITESGNVKYDAPHSAAGHADRAWALALAIQAGLTAPTYARMPS